MTGDLQASLRRLQESGRRRALFVAHSGGGGVGRHVRDLAHALEPHVEVLLLEPHAPGFVELRWLRSDEPLRLWFDASSDWEGLVGFLRALGLDRVHFHHVSGLPAAVLDLPCRLGCSHDLTLHDYFPACPAFHLADASGRYCGMAPDCVKCLEARPAQWPLTIAEWRARFATLLATADRVIAPCSDAAERIRAFFPQVSALVWPHPEAEGAPPPRPLRVLVPGAISTLKGFDVLRGCVEDAALRALPLHFVVLGFLGKPLPQWPDAPLTITGEYPEGALPGLIAMERGDVAFFPSQCPETYSYTLSEVLRCGLPIVASDLGAIAERLRDCPRARILPWHAPPSQMNDTLMSAAAAANPANALPLGVTSFEAYRNKYLAGLGARRAIVPEVAPEIADRWTREPVVPAETYPPAYLFEDGVVCGKARSLELLRRYLFDPDAAYVAREERFRELIATLYRERADAARSLAQERSEAARAAEQAAAAARELAGRLTEIRASTSWRMTSPLRRFVTLLRRRG